jgi:predicted ABC-type ATPase
VSTPILHVVAGPNGAGKTTFYRHVIAPIPLEFINADVIAAERWPGDELAHAYEAAAVAADRREQRFADRASFATETVFSHPSKLDLVARAVTLGYAITLHIVLIPEDLAVLRVRTRVQVGGHDVPEVKIRERHQRLWAHVRGAIDLATVAYVYDNSSSKAPFRLVAAYEHGRPTFQANWPTWTPPELARS